MKKRNLAGLATAVPLTVTMGLGMSSSTHAQVGGVPYSGYTVIQNGTDCQIYLTHFQTGFYAFQHPSFDCVYVPAVLNGTLALDTAVYYETHAGELYTDS